MQKLLRPAILASIGAVVLAPSAIGVRAQAPNTTSVHASKTPDSAHSGNSLDPARIKADEIRLMAFLGAHPDEPGALAGMGWVRSRQHNFPAAISFLERAKLKRPNDTRLVYALDSARFQLMLQEGDESLKDGDVATAEARYRAALQIRPHSQEALGHLHAARKFTAKRIELVATDTVQ